MACEWTHYISYHVCYVAKKNTIGDHPTFVGKVTKDSTNPDKNTYASTEKSIG
jgi:hypothetical protein